VGVLVADNLLPEARELRDQDENRGFQAFGDVLLRLHRSLGKRDIGERDKFGEQHAVFGGVLGGEEQLEV